MEKAKKIICLLLACFSLVLTAGCGGDKYEGKWAVVPAEKSQGYGEAIVVSIDKNGESYISTIEIWAAEIRNTSKKGARGPEFVRSWKKRTFGPVILKTQENNFSFEIGNMFFGTKTINFMYLEKTESLIMQADSKTLGTLVRYNDKDFEAFRLKAEEAMLLDDALKHPSWNVRFEDPLGI